MLLSTEIKDDVESIVGCVFPDKAGNPGNLTASSEAWSDFLRVQRYESISCELRASSIPTDTSVFIETSTFPQEPTASDWFVEDSYTWDPACLNFKYVNKNSEARYYRVRLVVGGGGDLTDLYWVVGGKHL